jgi:hypothetical protein
MTNATNIDKLPEQCFTILRTTGEPILIKRGENGYRAVQQPAVDKSLVTAKAFVHEMNTNAGVTAAQVLAMENGSMFGWDVPGADPDRCAEILARAKNRRGGKA